MKINISEKKLVIISLVVGIVGCVLMATGDYLMIYGDTDFQGKIAWLTKGVATIPPWRNNFAMIVAFPAIICYAVALFKMKVFICNDKNKKIYSWLTVIGLTPWLCLHLFYTMILFMFAYLSQNGQEQLALTLGEAVVAHFSWIIPVAEIFMLAPFIFWFVITLINKTNFSKWMCFNNPLIIYLVLKGVTMIMPNTPFRLAFTNGLMSESMIIWFLIYIIASSFKKSKTN